jgi:nucleoside-diphosphate-sugar epimerase
MADALSVAVSGSTGLIGSAFLEKIPEKIQITNRIHFKTLNVSEIPGIVETISSQGVDVFLHLGWPASTFEGDYRSSESNFDALQKTIVLKEACLRANISFVGIGSVVDANYDHGNLYQLAKFACRQMLEPDIQNETITWVRPYYVFDDGSWPNFLHADNGSPTIIQDNGFRDFIHIEDVVTGLWAIIQHQLKGKIDLGSGILKKPSDICEIYGKDFRVHSNSAEALGISLYDSAESHYRLSQYWAPFKTQKLFKERK